MNIIMAIKDEAVETFGPPIFVRTEMEGKRMFTNETNNPQSRIAANPEDYDLYKIGMWDDTSGEIQGMKPVKIMRAKDVKQTFFTKEYTETKGN